MPNSKQLKSELGKLANKKQAVILAGFFKTGPGQYGEGDIFLGLKSAQIKQIGQKFFNINFADVQKLLNSKIHEERMAALRILVLKYNKAKDDKIKKQIINFYLRNTKNVNNWDLVDMSCQNILGNYLLDKSRYVLYKLAKSKNLWEKRISIISTLAFIREKQFSDTLKIAEILLNDKHDLIHKAVGWMLREAGKRDQSVLRRFLDKHYKIMPRTMLRYAIEKLDEKKRMFYLSK
ncbi:MAG: DNA alkylation repair protein [bacterium]|nr:DNA alkylation repair protein [bacterium]